MDRFTLPLFGTATLSLFVGHYEHGGNTAVRILFEDDPETDVTVSVNVPGVQLPNLEFVFKTYSENAGLFEQMADAGIIEATGRTVNVGLAGPQPVCRLLHG